MNRPSVGLFVCCTFWLTSVPLRAEPTLTRCIPSAVVPGTTTLVELHGDRLTQPLKVWTSFPGKIEIKSVEAKKAIAAITVEPGVSTGPGGLMVATQEGACEPICLLIDDLPTIQDNDANHSIGTAQEVLALSAVDGVSNGSTYDYYQFSVAAGQRVAVDVLAQRIDSTFDPVVRLLDPTGKELLIADDDVALGADCRFSRTFSEAGKYVIEVRDNKYAAGGKYRLRIGDFPLVTAPLPLAGRIAETRIYGFAGPDAKAASSTMVVLPNNPLTRFLNVSTRISGGKSTSWAELMVGTLSQSIESEPNNEPQQATKVVIPCGISGQLQVANDRDIFEFVAAKGQAIRCSAATISLGSPTMLVMRMLDAKGQKLIETPVNDSDEWSFDFTFPSDGTYRLEVQDLLNRGGQEHVYHVSIAPAGSFELAIKNDKAARDRFPLEPSKGACAVDLTVDRFGYDGPIEVSLIGVPPGLRLHDPLIPAKAKEAKLFILADSTWPADAIAAANILGRATGDTRFETVARSTALLRTRAPHTLIPPFWREGLLNLAGVPAAEPFFAMKGPESGFFAKSLGQAVIGLTVDRKVADFKDPVVIVPEPLPTGFSASVKVDKEQYTVTVAGPKNSPVESLALNLKVFGTFKNRGRMESLTIPVKAIDPVSITAEVVGNLVAGKSQKVKVKVVRQGDDPQPLTLKWKSLPSGISSDEAITIPADKSEIEIELRASADIKAGVSEGILLEATHKFKGQDLTTNSAPLKLEIIAS